MNRYTMTQHEIKTNQHMRRLNDKYRQILRETYAEMPDNLKEEPLPRQFYHLGFQLFGAGVYAGYRAKRRTILRHGRRRKK
jgi:hypothetical protein